MSSGPIDNEYVWIQKMAEGDAAAFRVVYERYQGKVFAYALQFTKSKHIALEAVQQVFIRIWEKKTLINPQEPFEGYLMRTTQNHLINLLRDTARYQEKIAQLFEQIQRMRYEPEEYVLEKELADTYQKAIEALPPQKKLIYRMRQEEGLSHAEIGERLQISPLTAKKHMAEAVKMIRDYVQNHHELGFLVLTGTLCLATS